MGGGGHGQHRGTMPKARAKRTGPTLLRLWRYLGRQRAGLAAAFVLTALGAGLSLVGPYMIGRAIDDYILPRDYGGLLRLCGVLLAVYLVGSAAGWVQGYVMAGVSQRTVRELRRDLFARLQTLPLRFFDGRTHGELMSRATNDVENVSNSLNQSVSQLITSLLTVVGSLALMIGLNVPLTIVSLLTIPVIVVATGQIAKRTRRHFTEQQRHLGELNGFIEETVSGQKVVKAFNREERAIERFQSYNAKLAAAGTRAQIMSGLMGPANNVIGHLGFALIAAIGGWMVVRDLTTIGIVVSFLTYSRQFSRPINELANQYNLIQSAIAGAERVFEIMDTPSEYDVNRTDEAERVRKPIRGEVVLDGVTFAYKEGVPVLKRVSLKAEPGQTIALVGPTGAGKTTIVNLLTRFYDIAEGTATIDGVPLHCWDKDRLREQLGIVLQDAYLFSDTVRENIRYGKLDATDEQVEAAAKLANADGFIRKLPGGYDTVLSAEGGNLSQGQRQLITIARAILADPAVLILDEATSSIDTRTEMHVQEAMKSLLRGRTSFVIAHRLSTIREADQILVIDGGEIVERGTHEELLNRHGFYYELYSNQFRRQTQEPNEHREPKSGIAP
ncbi:multidrug ABC transporter ATP-binding protein [Paenibacillus flagellatus]|uniref:Multidrug ABC transporter ATP-binding protein n=2 Tax=Paenibacillus flagellatus TaxID=2211139 RepID=A0A2V5K0P0_9BACL|nr:ABC transporter ATP-binding protein [Paenibacillus flagellatus]PYI52708.1 multidrug ABC transporter ATP-binding protein [Paenibacillus flagellatus]